jgi:hypothetical protein
MSRKFTAIRNNPFMFHAVVTPSDTATLDIKTVSGLTVSQLSGIGGLNPTDLPMGFFFQAAGTVTIVDQVGNSVQYTITANPLPFYLAMENAKAVMHTGTSLLTSGQIVAVYGV